MGGEHRDYAVRVCRCKCAQTTVNRRKRAGGADGPGTADTTDAGIFAADSLQMQRTLRPELN